MRRRKTLSSRMKKKKGGGSRFYKLRPNQTKRKIDWKDKLTLPLYGRIYADWCGHCLAMNNDWFKLESEMKGKMNMVDIDDTYQRQRVPIINRILLPVPVLEKATGFPFIFRIRVDHTLDKYEGPRDLASMKHWLEN